MEGFLGQTYVDVCLEVSTIRTSLRGIRRCEPEKKFDPVVMSVTKVSNDGMITCILVSERMMFV